MGATVSGKPNFITIAHIGIMTHIGEIVQTYADESVLSGKDVDISKLKLGNPNRTNHWK